MQGFFFFWWVPSSRVWRVGEGVPMVAAHPRDFLMPQNRPRCQGRPQGRIFPQLLLPGAHPIELGCQCATQSSWDTSVPPNQTGIPAIYPYWEYLVAQ